MRKGKIRISQGDPTMLKGEGEKRSKDRGRK